MKQIIRCGWASPTNALYISYHDTEWGVPIFDDQKIFEYLILEGFQAGLSWEIILKKRENFKKAFANFNPKKVAKFTKADMNRLLGDVGIIRNRLKILAAINNAQRFLAVQKEFGSFNRYIWGQVDDKVIRNKFKKIEEIPAKTTDSDRISKDLLKKGFKFVGSTIIYAHMQATGMVNDHLVSCFRHKEV